MSLPVLLDAIMRSAEFDMVTHVCFHPQPFLGTRHRHARLYQLAYMVNGASRIETAGRCHVMLPGDAMFAAPGKAHGPAQDAGDEQAEMMQVKFALDRRLRPRWPDLIRVEARLEYETIFQKLFREYYMRRPVREYMLRTYLAQLILILINSLRGGARTGLPRERLAGRDEQKISLAMEWIAQHFRERITLRDIAAATGMSVSALCHAFKFFTGISPIRYLVDFRLAQALERMRRTDEKLDTIAADVGFTSASYLSRMFKQRFQQPPRQYAGRSGVCRYAEFEGQT
ncbi:MAG: helix-turn-helix domain-containing protein [Kiritimatiellia bacterium]|nr:AraC family transcriptional regulator [Lentisphaerota bacterium]